MLKNWFCYARNRVVPGGNRFPLNPKLLILWFLVPGTGLSLGGNRFPVFCLWFFVPGTGLSLGGNRFLCVIFVFSFLTSNLHNFSLVTPIFMFFISSESF